MYHYSVTIVGSTVSIYMFIEFQVVFDVTHGERHRVPHFKETVKMILRMVCPKCREEILMVASSVWNAHFQRWEVKETRDARYWCPSCGDVDQPIEVTRTTEADWNMSDEILWDGTPEDKERQW